MSFRWGEWVTFWTKDEKIFVFPLRRGERLQTHLGVLEHEQIRRAGPGRFVGYGWAFRATPEDWVLHAIQRKTQILYPKDSGYLLLKLGIRDARRVLEVGTGSGAMTCVLAWMLRGKRAEIVSYDRRTEFQELARKNLRRLGLEGKVRFRQPPIEEVEAFDLAIVDVRHPEEVLPVVHRALVPGGAVGILVPTVNQVVRTLEALREGFQRVEVVEVLQRQYRPIPERVRPEDRMTAHTGYILTGRKVEGSAL